MAEYKDTTDKKAYSWLGGKAQLLLCRVAAPKPDFSWTLRKIREETKDANQLGFTDSTFESALVSNPKAEAAGYFSGRAALKTTVIRIPKELDVTDAQIKAAEAKKDKPEAAKRLKALRACRDHLVAHELAHIDKAWDSLSEMSLGWEKKLGTLAEGTAVTTKHIEAALDEGDANAPTKIVAAATKWDSDDLGASRPLQGRAHFHQLGRGRDVRLHRAEGRRLTQPRPSGGQSPTMSIWDAGVDLGATLVKAVAVPVDRPLPSFETFVAPAGDERLLDAFLLRHSLRLVAATGGGAASLADRLAPARPVLVVDEFASWGAGEPILTGRAGLAPAYPHLLVSLGTGTSILRMEEDGTVARVGGTALGGGTLRGLGRLLLGNRRPRPPRRPRRDRRPAARRPPRGRPLQARRHRPGARSDRGEFREGLRATGRRRRARPPRPRGRERRPPRRADRRRPRLVR
ncbi:MAG: hypothetical protein IPL90_16595 [Holophagales bacterium]|nr:hypothetical protein [Holophagales bacterium]